MRSNGAVATPEVSEMVSVSYVIIRIVVDIERKKTSVRILRGGRELWYGYDLLLLLPILVTVKVVFTWAETCIHLDRDVDR